ncbi:MAG: hypothetical protein A3E98_01940 [Candidatus Doudnabacteria bacterium RIFCSPHIGHO2_12_FULL_48_11]|uniref:Uncharacterized protein n=1 Tax=Candidatus Doudnabacteria bacterium RIFCSPHIGHO2_01_FULL_46_24 TaxID=1817825 RepID=A0A1F5NVL8_9BACT|nr:MAG: hypothetical protein A2720_02255 [Candidatus Doudnabacteria bacterium RIFCSPHIGHO2_01_FULL_46_24]OGE95552.1 MAG: hypothetical protein A3E98_01940 [Candidatus Doudnabacteria bacterium RIFCSPHIGHO2_12_FULL_48_11]
MATEWRVERVGDRFCFVRPDGSATRLFTSPESGINILHGQVLAELLSISDYRELHNAMFEALQPQFRPRAATS